MPDWYFGKSALYRTPSQKADASERWIQLRPITFDTEMRYRREGVRFIIEVGKALGLSHQTMASASVYFHRFYMFHTFQQFPRFVTATTALFLAGKAEETPKKCRDLIRSVRSLMNESQFATFDGDPREDVMAIERVLLQTIKFDLHITHPYASVIKYAKCLQSAAQTQEASARLEKMVQMAWTFVNDSLSTTLCLQFDPEVIAIALMYLASKLSKFEIKDWKGRKSGHKHWWDQYVEDLDTETLEDICHQVLDLYAEPSTLTSELPPSPSTTFSRSRNSNFLSDDSARIGEAHHTPVSISRSLSRSRSGSTSQSPKSMYNKNNGNIASMNATNQS